MSSQVSGVVEYTRWQRTKIHNVMIPHLKVENAEGCACQGNSNCLILILRQVRDLKLAA